MNQNELDRIKEKAKRAVLERNYLREDVFKLITEIERLNGREKLWMEYCDLLADELGGQAAFMWVHGMRSHSSKVQRGQRLRDGLGIKEHPILPDAKPLEESVEEEIITRSSNPDFLPDEYYMLRMSGKSKEEIQSRHYDEIYMKRDKDD